MKRVAIVGSGIAGLACAWFLRRDFDVTVFENDDRAGGHSHTVEVDEAGRRVAIDTGFMVFNRVTYPNLVRLFEVLGVPVKPTDMSFSVRHGPRDLEYCGSSLNHLFAQRRNLLSPSFYRMLLHIDRFNREAVAALEDPAVRTMTLEDYVRRGGYGDDFFHLYLIPMSSAVWSTPPERMMKFPAASLLRFFHNHGFLGLHTQHPWWTVEGGSRSYVSRLLSALDGRVRLGEGVRRVRRADGVVEVETDFAVQRYDKVVLACHAPTSLALLGREATSDERRLLAAFKYQPNTATLHTDASVMPRTERAWSSWNYRLEAAMGRELSSDDLPSNELRVSTHYWMNRLQGVSDREDYFVSINGAHLVHPSRILRTLRYEHPLFDRGAVEAQGELAGLNAGAQGGTETYYAGAWQRYGFHEDGLLSAVRVAELLLGRDPWLGAKGEAGA